MEVKEAKEIVSKVRTTPYDKRIRALPQQDWDFINTLNRWFERYPAWQEVRPYWAKRLAEINEKLNKMSA